MSEESEEERRKESSRKLKLQKGEPNPLTQREFTPHLKFSVCDFSNVRNVKTRKNDATSLAQLFFGDHVDPKNKPIPVFYKAFFELPEDVHNSNQVEYWIYRYLMHHIYTLKIAPFPLKYYGMAKCTNFYNEIIQRLPERDHSKFLEALTNLFQKSLDVWVDNKQEPLETFQTGIMHILAIERLENFEFYDDFLQRKDVSLDDYVSVWFQIFFALFIMEEYGIVHNDLHNKNIAIQKLPKETVIAFIAKGRSKRGISFCPEMYLVRTKYLVRVFDFDRASASGIYNTFLYSNYMCEDWAQCNVQDGHSIVVDVLNHMDNTNHALQNHPNNSVRNFYKEFIGKVVGGQVLKDILQYKIKDMGYFTKLLKNLGVPYPTKGKSSMLTLLRPFEILALFSKFQIQTSTIQDIQNVLKQKSIPPERVFCYDLSLREQLLDSKSDLGSKLYSISSSRQSDSSGGVFKTHSGKKRTSLAIQRSTPVVVSKSKHLLKKRKTGMPHHKKTGKKVHFEDESDEESSSSSSFVDEFGEVEADVSSDDDEIFENENHGGLSRLTNTIKKMELKYKDEEDDDEEIDWDDEDDESAVSEQGEEDDEDDEDDVESVYSEDEDEEEEIPIAYENLTSEEGLFPDEDSDEDPDYDSDED